MTLDPDPNMFQVVLYQPEIAPNTGNVIRLCANTGSRLHLIEPLGFEPDDAKLKRAGLDYHDWAEVSRWPSFADFLKQARPPRVYTLSTRHEVCYAQARFQAGDALVFGPETRGLPEEVREMAPAERRLTLPMMRPTRSLNLANSVAVVVYEAWRQLDFQCAG